MPKSIFIVSTNYVHKIRNLVKEFYHSLAPQEYECIPLLATII